MTSKCVTARSALRVFDLTLVAGSSKGRRRSYRQERCRADDLETIFSKKTNIVSPGRLAFLPLISQLQSDTNQKEGFSASFFNTEAKTELSSFLLAQLAAEKMAARGRNKLQNYIISLCFTA